MSAPGQQWACEAYGPDEAVQAADAVCFVSGELGKWVCGDLGERRRVMAAQRRRLFRRINELAAQGNETAAYLAGEFASPERLLSGDDDPECE